LSDASGALIFDIIIDINRLCLCLMVILLLDNWKDSVKTGSWVNPGT
jgi:hypothetical protein